MSNWVLVSLNASTGLSAFAKSCQDSLVLAFRLIIASGFASLEGIKMESFAHRLRRLINGNASEFIRSLARGEKSA